MVDAVSNGPIEGEILTSAIVDEPKVEETPKKKSSESIDSKGRLKKFLENGGAQHAYHELLKTLYGEKLVQRAFPKGWKETLSQDNCLEILERIGHSLTLEDLEGFYAELKSGTIKSEVLKHAMVPYLRMWWSGSVRELPPYWMAHFIDLFRNPLKELKLGIEAEKINHIDKGATLYTHYSHQVSRLQEKGERSRPEFYYASRELLAKSVAYADPQSVKDGAIIPVFNVELGRQVFYTLKGQVHNSGLHAYLFVPLEKGEEFPAQLLFRGTNGYASVGRDLDSCGVGKRVFAANVHKIEALVKEAKTSKIEVIGHSLGAADAQRGVALLVDPQKTFNFKEISLYAFCAPRLEIERVNKWKAELKALAEENKHPVIRLNFAHHESDVVTWTGDSYLSGAELDFIYSNYLTVRSNSGALQTPDHHTTSFYLDGNFNFEIDGRTFEFRKSFPNAELSSELQKLEEIENSWQWWRGVKSYFIKVESKEEIERRIEEMQRHQADISAMEKGGSQHSWMVYSGWSAIRYTVQPVVYYTFEGIRALGRWRG
ncbi:MAG: hypothetical protein KFB93_04820 [Simkaniaceae bacterium]|nr:MAG: hypothetical protein KFB93_04820 [Simkaniaceae bacterium]